MIELYDWFNRRAKRLSVLDIKLAQGCAIFLTLIVVTLAPEILRVNIWWWVLLLGLCAIKPVYVFFVKQDQAE